MSAVNEMQQSLLEAMQALGANAANNTNAALTIKCTILSVVDAGLRLYEVKYGENSFNAYASSNSTYAVGDIVYVLVPDGDLAQQKIIIGASAPRASMFESQTETDSYISVSDNLFKSISDVDLKSWVDESFNVGLDSANFGTIFTDYLNTYRYFLFSAKIKTEIDKDHQVKGNYGLILNLPFTQKSAEGGGASTSVWKSYAMDVTTIQGNPYDFDVYQQVNLYEEVEEGLIYDNTRDPFITAFTSDFGYAVPRTDIVSDIHIKDISVQMVDVLTENDRQGYYLSVVADDGNYFLNGRYTKDKILSPVLKINGVNTNIDKWNCYWFVEDSSVNISHPTYLQIGGLGWKCLNKKTNVSYDSTGKQTFQYVTSQRTFKVKETDVVSTLRYKCVLVQDELVVGGKIKLINLNHNIKTELVSATGSNSFVADVGYVDLIAKIKYPGITDVNRSDTNISLAWQRFDKFDNYIDDDFYEIIRYNDPVDGYWETEIKYPCTMLDQLNTINCSFYSSSIDGGEVVKNNLGSASIVVSAASGFTYGLAIRGGDVVYKYDADGDSPFIANYDGPLSSKMTTINPISYRVYKADGSELNSTEYLYCKYTWSFPKNSMMRLEGYNLQNLEQDDDYYYVTGYGTSELNYSILNTFNKKKSNNTIILKVEFDNNILNDTVSPKFLKDGMSGTNGSKYSAIITYNNHGYGDRDTSGRPYKFQAVYVNGAGWKIINQETRTLVDFGSPKFQVNVYKDGALINNGYRVSWEIFDSTSTDICFNINQNGVLSTIKNWYTSTDIYCNTIEAVVTITQSSLTNSQEILYVYYPIEITRLISAGMINKNIPQLDGGFEEVVYASDGTNPSYDNTNPFECIDDIYKNDEDDLYDYTWSSSTNLPRSGSGTGPIATFKPITKFDNGKSKNFIKVILSMSNAKRTEIQNKINTLNSQINDTQNLINFYQNNKSHILDFVSNFSYNNYKELLDNTRTLLSYRNQELIIINNLKDALQNIYNYCVESNIKIVDFNYINYYNSCGRALSSAYKDLYRLGSGKTLSDLDDLSDIIIRLDESRITEVYGAGVASQLKSYVQTYNLQITNKYQDIYTSLVRLVDDQYILQPELDALISFNTLITQFPQNSSLRYLTEEHDSNQPEQEFINLKNQLLVLVSQITDVTKDLISYSAFVDNLLNPINELLKIYLNTDYQNSYYEKILNELNENLTNYNNQLKGYQDSLLPSATDNIIHIKPIVMLFNRYEMSNINAWDGNKLYIDSQNNEYLLAPQIGAGTKVNGKFTGIVMGIKQFNRSGTGTQQIGLFGYGEGIQSFFLNSEDGSAILGKSGAGQITIDPSQNKALIYSSNYWINYKSDGKPSSYGSSNLKGEGMLIDLSTPEIRFGSGNFVVNKDGHITAKGGGSIAGWNITNNQLYSNTTIGNGRITLDSQGVGKIYSHSHTGLNSTNTGFYLSSDGLSIGNSIRVTAAEGGSILIGRINGSNYWTISGDSSNSYIAYGTTTFNSGSNSVYLGTNGISLGVNKFYVDNAGNLTSKAGTIGNWNINATSLSAGNTTLYSSGTIECSNLYANNSGEIGGWSIGSSSLTGGNTTLNSNGTITCDTLYANNSGSIGGWNINSGSLTNGSLTLGGGQILGPSFTLGSGGLNLTGGLISFGGVTLDGSSFSMNEDSTNLGGKNIKTRVGELCADKISADYISGKIASLNSLGVVSLHASSAVQANTMSCSSTFTVNDVQASSCTLIAGLSGSKADHGTYTVTGTINGGAIPFSLKVEI